VASAAMDDKESADKLATALRSLDGVTDKTIESTEQWISSMQLATHVSDTELRTGLSRLALATGDVKVAQNLLTVAMDTAAASGESLDTVTQQLAKAAAGNTDALKRSKPWLDKNKDGTLTLAEAVNGLSAAYGGSAQAAANRRPWEKIKIIFGEIQEALGEAFLPLLDTLGRWFKDPRNRDRIQKFIDKIAELARQFGEKAARAIQNFFDWLSSPQGKRDIQTFIARVQSIINYLQSLWNMVNAVIGIFQSLYHWIRNIPSPASALQGIANRVRGVMSLSPVAAGAGAAPAGVTPAAIPPQTITINVAAADPWSTAREMKRIIERADLLVGRAPGQPVAVAW